MNNVILIERTSLIRMLHRAEDTKALLKRYGWLQGHAGGPERGYCLVSAMREARTPWRFDSYISKSLNMPLGDDRPLNLMHWNDDKKRTKDEVLRAIDRAEDLIEEDLRREYGMTNNEIRRLRRRDDDQRSVAS